MCARIHFGGHAHQYELQSDHHAEERSIEQRIAGEIKSSNELHDNGREAECYAARRSHRAHPAKESHRFERKTREVDNGNEIEQHGKRAENAVLRLAMTARMVPRDDF